MDTLEEIKGLIGDIRNSRDLSSNLPKFFHLVSGRQAEIIDTFSIRWLVSICDTFADHGGELERRNALLISNFVNMLRLAETVRYISGPLDPAQLQATRGGLVELYDGVCTFAIDRQDVYLNLAKRMARLLPATPFLFEIWVAILHRLHGGDNVITALKAISLTPERYFPVAPLDMPDNYGIR